MTRLSTAFAGRYVIERELGVGGMATVYLTADLKHRRKVAVKVLRPELAAALGRDRFLREIEILGHLSHPHILPLHDSGVVDEVCFFVTPYIQGESLRARLDREGQLPIDDALQIAREIADALAYAHGRGVIHRDIKPQNIMLESGHAVLADFGIALAVDAATLERLTGTGFSPGTPHYMSPEQASAARRMDGRSDIYSLGCVLYEMLAGDPPFTGSNLYAIMARHAAEPPGSLRVVRDTVSESLESVCFRALAKAPADRYRTAEEFVEALTEVAHERVRETGPLGPRTTQPRPFQPTTIPEDGDGAGAKDRQSTDQGRAGYRQLTLRLGLGTLGTATLLTLVGFLTISIHDTQLQYPPQYTPSESNYLLRGGQALVLPITAAFVASAVVLFLYYLAERTVAGIEHLPLLGSRVHRLRQGVAKWWSRFRDTARPAMVADSFFAGAIVVTALAVSFASPFLAAVFTSDVAAIGCESRFARWSYQSILGVAAFGLLVLRFSVLKWVRRRTGRLDGTAIARWGSAALIVLLVIVMTLPWRIVIAPGKERIRMGADRGYILHETTTEVLIYNATRGTTSIHPRSGLDTFTRLGINGYVFEEPHVFDSGQQKCYSVYSNVSR